MLQSPPEVVTLVLRQLSDVSTCDTDYHDCRVGLVSCIKMGLGTCWSDVARVELLRVVRLRQSHGNTSDMTSFIEHVCSTAGSFDVVKEIELSCDSGQHGTMFGLEKFDGLRRLSLKGGHWSFGGLGRPLPIKILAISNASSIQWPSDAKSLQHVERLELRDIYGFQSSGLGPWYSDEPQFGNMRSLSIRGFFELDNSDYDRMLSAVDMSNVQDLALQIEPSWDPRGLAAGQLRHWLSDSFEFLTRLKTLRLTLVTINPWLALAMRAVRGGGQRQDGRPVVSEVERLQIVLQPDKEGQRPRDLALTFSRIVMTELGNGALAGLRKLDVGAVDAGGNAIKDDMVTPELVKMLDRRGITLSMDGRESW